MKKVLFISILFAVSTLIGKEITITGQVVNTPDEAGGGYGLQTKKGVYQLCYEWDNANIVNQLNSLNASATSVQIKGKVKDKWTLDCNSLKIKK